MNAPVERRAFIGGSDAAAILGVSPWHTPLDLFLIKTGQKAEFVDPARERLFKRGKRLEPVVIDMLIEEYGVKITKRSLPEAPNRYVHPQYSFLAAEIDFEWQVTAEIAERFDLPEDLIGSIQNGEVKTVHPFASAKFGDAETDEIPVEYAAQAMHGLMVTGRQLCMFGVLVGADNLNVYWIKRDDETIAGMRAQEIDFWSKHVLAGAPPAPVNLPDVLALFGRKAASRIEATAEIHDLVDQLKAARAAQYEGDKIEEELKFQIGQFMLGAEAVVLDDRGKLRPAGEIEPGAHELTAGGAPILTVGLQTQQRLDGERLKRDHPQIAAECVKATSFFTFSTPRKKAK